MSYTTILPINLYLLQYSMNYRTQIILISHENKGRRVHTPNKYLLTYQKKEIKINNYTST